MKPAPMYLVRSLVPANIQVREEIRKRNVHVLADPDQILQIIMNLCTNAEQGHASRAGWRAQRGTGHLSAEQGQDAGGKARSFCALDRF